MNVATLKQRAGEAPWVGFVLKGLAVYAIWFVLYDLWLLPDGRLDAWLSEGVAAWAGGLLRLFGARVHLDGRVVGLDGHPGVLLADGCNGLTTLGLFVGFVLAYPGSWRLRRWFLPAGVLVILLVNVLRVVALVLVQGHAPGLFEGAHDVGANAIFYLAVFALWVVWAQLADRAAPPAEQGPTKVPISAV